jgi:alkanesulfonate monooxygenase SsuD/methylene tetrahydromethanopterin reductase-like flavin-dependent oxidoreductase (luciferase family)
MFRPAEAEAFMPPTLDAMTALAALGAVTSSVQVGTSVVVAAQWPPALFAQMATTLDHLTRGRLLLGLGAGWERVQLEANGLPFERRGARLEELMAVLRHLWSGSREAFDGEFYRLPALRVAPSLRPGGPPLLLGGRTPAGLRRAARLGDGFISAGGPPDAVRREFEQVTALREELGRGGDFQLWAQVRAPKDGPAWRETLAAYGAVGAGGVIVRQVPNLLDLLRGQAGG